jgi:hypothetical protein
MPSGRQERQDILSSALARAELIALQEPKVKSIVIVAVQLMDCLYWPETLQVADRTSRTVRDISYHYHPSISQLNEIPSCTFCRAWLYSGKVLQIKTVYLIDMAGNPQGGTLGRMVARGKTKALACEAQAPFGTFRTSRRSPPNCATGLYPGRPDIVH